LAEEVDAKKREFAEPLAALNFFDRALAWATSGDIPEEERECKICFAEMSDKDMAMTACAHLFCYKCVSDAVRQRRSCPTCRHPLSQEKISYFSDIVSDTQDEDDEKRMFGSKIVAIRNVLRKIQMESDDQSIIFIQFSSILDVTEKALTEVGITTFVMRGQVKMRTRILNEFKRTPKSVLLLSLEQSPSGMNLVNANHCLIIHPMLTDSQEEADRFERQAIGRICRQGQTKPCFIYRFVTKGTIEEDLLREHHSDQVPPELASSS
jgi:SNF2 family DNA or RNA helicase